MSWIETITEDVPIKDITGYHLEHFLKVAEDIVYQSTNGYYDMPFINNWMKPDDNYTEFKKLFMERVFCYILPHIQENVAINGSHQLYLDKKLNVCQIGTPSIYKVSASSIHKGVNLYKCTFGENSKLKSEVKIKL